MPLSPEDQAFIANLHKGGIAPPSVAQSDWYQKLAQPVTRAVAHGISGLASQLTHPGPAGVGELQRNLATPADKLPPFATEFWKGGISPMSAAQMVVPQTKTAAAIDAASFLLPEAKGAEMMGETLGPMAKLFGSRPGRMATMATVGGATGALTGEGGLAGATQGALSSLPEPVTAITGAVGRKLGGAKLEQTTTRQFAKAIKQRMPWLGKLEDGHDFAIQFRHGEAIQAASRLLNRVKNDIGQQVRGYDFAVGLPKAFSVLNPQTPAPQRMGFHELDNLITELQKGMGFTAGGGERSGVSGRGARMLAHEIRDHLAKDLESIKPGLGAGYLRARKKFDITSTMHDIFKAPKGGGPDILTRHGIDQDLLLRKLDAYAEDLERGFGSKGAARDLQQLLRRGFTGTVTDVPGEAGRGHFVMGVGGLPHYRVYPGHAPEPVGPNIPGYMRPSSKKYEGLISNLIGSYRGPNAGPRRNPIVPAADKKRIETIAGPHADATRIGDVKTVSEKIAKPGKPANVDLALKTGRVSIAQVRDMLDAGGHDLSSVFKGLSMQDSIDTLAKASPQEREVFLPVIAQKIQDEAKGKSPQEQQFLVAQLKAVMGQGAQA